MPFSVRVHFDNASGFGNPYLWPWSDGSSATGDSAPSGHDDFGPYYDLTVVRPEFRFRFKEGPGTDGPWEPDSLNPNFGL